MSTSYDISSMKMEPLTASLKEVQRKIKILFLIDVIYFGGGTERHLAEVVTNLDPSRFDCAVRVIDRLDETAPSVRQIREAGIPCIALGIHRAYDPNGLLQALKLAYLIRKERFDIVQTFHLVSDTYGVMAARMGGAPAIVSSRRDMDTFNVGMRRIARKCAGQFIHRFIAVCNAVGRNFQKMENVPQQKITTIYNGVDLSRFSPTDAARQNALKELLGIRPASFVIGNVSVFRPMKDYDVFFEAIRRIAPSIPDLKVLAVGPGPLMDQFKRSCGADPLLKDIVVFTGGVSNVQDYVSLMDVACLCPSENEGLSNAILEEMALAKPVVATDVGGNAELVVQGETGFITSPGNAQQLAEAFLLLYRDPDLRRRMGRKARKRVRSEFALQRMIRDMEQFYQDLYEEKH